MTMYYMLICSNVVMGNEEETGWYFASLIFFFFFGGILINGNPIRHTDNPQFYSRMVLPRFGIDYGNSDGYFRFFSYKGQLPDDSHRICYSSISPALRPVFL